MAKEKNTSNVMKQIDENLRRAYEQAEREDVPDRFKELLDRLKDQDSEGSQDNRDE